MTASTTPRTTSPRRRIATLEQRLATAADAPARHLTEAQFRHDHVQNLLNLHHWRWAYWPDSRYMQGHKGPPDILAVRPPRLVFIETKRTGKKPRVEQMVWRGDLLACPSVEHYIWTPSDLAEIESVLR